MSTYMTKVFVAKFCRCCWLGERKSIVPVKKLAYYRRRATS